MLSILIPTYNYNVYPLALELEKQALQLGIDFELICMDDGSFSTLNETNQNINTLTNCKFIENKKNIGRSAIRNLLAKKANYDWLLFLDADVMPTSKNLLSNYINALKTKHASVIYGGILYQETPPKKDTLLRWVYGKEREALSLEKRNKSKYLRFLTLCFLIKKEVFKKVQFNESIKNLRHEDTLFAYDLMKANITLEHIDNPVYHCGLENSKVFLEKSLQSVEGLLELINNGLLPSKHAFLSRVYKISKLTFTNHFLAFIYKKHKAEFENNLLSLKPCLFLFDLYRLCYLCYLDKTK